MTETPQPCAGATRPATQGDAEVLQAWYAAFHDEAVPLDPAPSPDAGARAVERGTAWLWVDCAVPERGGIVACASFGRDLGEYLSVGPVYTPPEFRGRGYAINLVAAMSTWAVTQACHGCTLFTDLANPTSNAIYERIGYRRVGTMCGYRWS